MFSGLGSQYVGMGRGLFESDVRFRANLVRCDDAAALTFGHGFLEPLFPVRSERGAVLADTGLAMAALFSFQYALARTLIERGAEPDRLLGYSLGEFVALTVAGAMSLERALAILAHLERVLASDIGAGRGGMTAVLAGRELMEHHPERFRGCTLAGVNSQQNFIVAGSCEALDTCEVALGADRVVHQRLAVEYAFHSPVVEGAGARFASGIATRFAPIRIPVILCSDPTPLQVPTLESLWRAVRAPADFVNRTAPLCEDPVACFLDLGPSGTLASALKGRVDPRRAVAVVNPFTSAAPDLDGIAELHGESSNVAARV